MVKISIELDDIIKGEKLRKSVVRELELKGIPLPERHAGLWLDDMAEIAFLNKTKNQTEIKIKYNNTLYDLKIQNFEDGPLRAGLTCLYGYGHIRYDYELPVFETLSEEDTVKYMKLAIEIWERNIHRDWMRKCGYETHNGTKDELFLYQMITDLHTAVQTHRERSEHREKGDTPHHLFNNPKLIRRIVERQGVHELNDYFIESFYDKVTAPTRIWFEERTLPFEERHNKNRDLGYYVNPEFRWKPGVFGFTNDYETKLQKLWLDIHCKFKEYWTSKFGKNEELWQPPAPLGIVEKITERFK